MSTGVALLQDNARPHTATTCSTRALLADFAWIFFFILRVFQTFHLFTYLKQFLGSTHVGCDEEVKKTVKFSGLEADFYDAGVQKLVTRHDYCLNLHGNYVEK
jgi:hypothetical protein